MSADRARAGARLTFETRQQIREARSARIKELRPLGSNEFHPIGIEVGCERRECRNVFIVRQEKQRFCSERCRKYENQRHHDRSRGKAA